MKVFNAILGVFALFASVYMMCFPGVSFLKIGWIVTVLLCVWGVCALFEALAGNKKSDKLTVGRAILALVGGIAAGVVSVLALTYPVMSVWVDLVAIWIFIAWLLTSGISSIFAAVKVVKPTGSKSWIFTLILGILTTVCGAYGIFHMVAMAQTIGLLIGAMLMVYGVRLLASVFEK